jgi:hypothetical protein
MAIGLMWNDQVVELSGVPEPDEATLNLWVPKTHRNRQPAGRRPCHHAARRS